MFRCVQLLWLLHKKRDMLLGFTEALLSNDCWFSDRLNTWIQTELSTQTKKVLFASRVNWSVFPLRKCDHLKTEAIGLLSQIWGFFLFFSFANNVENNITEKNMYFEVTLKHVDWVGKCVPEMRAEAVFRQHFGEFKKLINLLNIIDRLCAVRLPLTPNDYTDSSL